MMKYMWEYLMLKKKKKALLFENNSKPIPVNEPTFNIVYYLDSDFRGQETDSLAQVTPGEQISFTNKVYSKATKEI